MLFLKNQKVFVYLKPIDMRYGFERLSYFIESEMNHNLDTGHIYIFLGKNKKRLKALYFDGSGLIQIIKKMEKKKCTFMSVFDLESRSEITKTELELMLHGSTLKKYKPLKEKQKKNENHLNSF